MSRLNWGATGERTYEVGVDRGVLYVEDGRGIAWNGLISVSEAATGGDAKPYYIDGIKYLNRARSEEFEASIEAYTYPDEFARFDGTASLGRGLFATQQPRRPFGLAYRSMVGNDVDGSDFAYKIHLVYGALAAPSEQVHGSMSDSVEPFNFTWQLTTKPPRFGRHRPTAHFIIDSRQTPEELLEQVEDILYGTETVEARLPELQELVYLFDSFQSSVFDGGDLNDPQYAIFDGGIIPEAQASTIDGGGP